MSANRHLVLASTSRYRRELLERLAYPFDTCSPGVDEASLPGESPSDTARRLSELKAQAVAERFPDALIIGSDQVAHLGDTVLGKPGTHEQAVLQLGRVSGQRVDFVTGVCVYDSKTRRSESRCVLTQVEFRPLSPAVIERYLRLDQPYDCAGSAKSEGLGIALIAGMSCPDPTALIGLPLIALCDLLALHGLELLR
jgi:septum formation protein